MTPKQRQYIEGMTRQLGIGRYWSDGVRYVFGGSMPRVFYDPGADDSREVSRVIETLQRRFILQRIEDKAKGERRGSAWRTQRTQKTQQPGGGGGGICLRGSCSRPTK